ncbi:MalY/PatB family protein [Halanaerobium praevalens]|uniref:cysteine-S-conjugate beta-lyase n=1 Tax=Halanaerobium praevalens (strain ATCC 33744 / DSM 2228 / GSL) TaxID=572479 RepID=E3DS09_HALPG|nr:MalY/PatB family protein [Halanaerobium praevalens]ADO77133.1 aminotransferase class I and II [Halanaerobium praevalens DSM 2228]
MNSFNFSKLENRQNTMSIKWDKREAIFGNKDILPLWVADSDWQTAPLIKAELIKRAQTGIFGYSFPNQSIKTTIYNWLKNRFDLEIEKEWLVFGTGVVPAINFALKTITKANEAVIIQPPVYRPFFEAVKNNNCQLIKNNLVKKNNYYQMDLVQLKKQIKAHKKKGIKVKALIFCSPHNPVGRVWKKKELLALLRLLKKEDIYLLSDEIHADLVYSNYQHQPLLKLLLAKAEFKEYRKKVISFMSASKTFNIAGLHTSYTLIEAKELRKAYQKTKAGFATSNSPFGLLALKTAYNEGEKWLEAQLKYLEANYRFLQKYIKENIKEIKVSKAEGTYLVWLDCSQLGFTSDQKLIEFMNQKAGVGLNPGIWFGKESGSMHLRLNLACPQARLKKALTKIKKAVKNRSK